MPDVIAGLDRDEKEQKAAITLEMIEAGVDALAGFSARDDSYEDVVRDIFTAMAVVRCRQ